jgi:hypothetical protein
MHFWPLITSAAGMLLGAFALGVFFAKWRIEKKGSKPGSFSR